MSLSRPGREALLFSLTLPLAMVSPAIWSDKSDLRGLFLTDSLLLWLLLEPQLFLSQDVEFAVSIV